jgi:hypothetical protein
LPSNSQGTSPVSYNYTARFCAADGTSCTNASKTVTVAAGAAPAPGPTSCGNLAIIEPRGELNAQQRILTFDGARYLTSGFGSASTNVVVAQINVPANIRSGTSSLQVYEYGTSKTSRRVWLSKTRCDFSATASPYNPTPSNGPSITVKVGGANDPAMVSMQPGETWYLMVKNEKIVWGTVSSSCSGTCDVAIELSAPN